MLPLRVEPYVSERGPHPFFDNLVAEGWFRDAQARALGIDPGSRFALLLGFGHDLAGAVSVEDPEPAERKQIDHADAATIAALLGRASLSGIQRKVLVVRDGKSYRPVGPDELSTHIAKLPSGNLTNLLELEYLTTFAVRTLLPGDETALARLRNQTSARQLYANDYKRGWRKDGTAVSHQLARYCRRSEAKPENPKADAAAAR